MSHRLCACSHLPSRSTRFNWNRMRMGNGLSASENLRIFSFLGTKYPLLFQHRVLRVILPRGEKAKWKRHFGPATPTGWKKKKATSQTDSALPSSRFREDNSIFPYLAAAVVAMFVSMSFVTIWRPRRWAHIPFIREPSWTVHQTMRTCSAYNQSVSVYINFGPKWMAKLGAFKSARRALHRRLLYMRYNRRRRELCCNQRNWSENAWLWKSTLPCFSCSRLCRIC